MLFNLTLFFIDKRLISDFTLSMIRYCVPIAGRFDKQTVNIVVL